MRKIREYNGNYIKKDEKNGQVVHIKETKKHKILTRNPHRKRSLTRLGCRWEDNIQMDLTKTGHKNLKWIKQAQFPGCITTRKSLFLRG
jgi:hypothetical protein